MAAFLRCGLSRSRVAESNTVLPKRRKSQVGLWVKFIQAIEAVGIRASGLRELRNGFGAGACTGIPLRCLCFGFADFLLFLLLLLLLLLLGGMMGDGLGEERRSGAAMAEGEERPPAEVRARAPPAAPASRLPPPSRSLAPAPRRARAGPRRAPGYPAPRPRSLARPPRRLPPWACSRDARGGAWGEEPAPPRPAPPPWDVPPSA